jgi:hypothetical protein
MGTRLTKEKILERLLNEGRNFTLVGEYLGSGIKTTFKCSNNHEWMTRPNNIFAGKGCPLCADLTLSKDIINERLRTRCIKLIGDYTNMITNTLFKCASDHIWSARPGNILSGRGCPRCYESILSRDIVNERLSISDREIKMIGEYINSATKTLFECNDKHTWMASPGQVLKGHGCPYCCVYGFNPNKSAVIYLLDFGKFIKYGISNNISRRLYEHTKSGSYKVTMTMNCSGHQAIQWEKYIKEKFGGRYVSKKVLPDGYTETLSPELIDEILDTMKSIITY